MTARRSVLGVNAVPGQGQDGQATDHCPYSKVREGTVKRLDCRVKNRSCHRPLESAKNLPPLPE
jgi:hypothetical protein